MCPSWRQPGKWLTGPHIFLVDHNHTTTILRLFFRDHPGELVPEETFWTFMVQGKINRGRHTDRPAWRHSMRSNHCPPPPSPHIFYRSDALPAAQPIVSKHWRQMYFLCNTYEFSCWKHCLFLYDSCLTLVPVQTGCDSQIHLKYIAVGLSVSVIIASCSCLDKHCTAASCIVPECQFELHISVVQYCFLTTIMPCCVHSFFWYFLVVLMLTVAKQLIGAGWFWVDPGFGRGQGFI